MAAKKSKKRSYASPRKAAVKNRTVAPIPLTDRTGAPVSDQDVKRRLGNFSGAGEHARQGSRTSGIGGQTKQRFRTDNKSAHD